MAIIDPKSLGFPDEDTMSCEDGLVENHHYIDLRWMDLDDYHRIRDQERELLDFAEGGGDLGSDEAAEDFCDNEVYLLGLDPGVASTVAALAALGAVPVTSCSGGPGHYETHPLVLCWALPEHAQAIQEAAEEAGVEVEGVQPPAVLIFTPGDVSLMQEFADRLVAKIKGEADGS